MDTEKNFIFGKKQTTSLHFYLFQGVFGHDAQNCIYQFEYIGYSNATKELHPFIVDVTLDYSLFKE